MNNLTTTQKAPPALVYVSKKRFIYLGQVQMRMKDSHSGASWIMLCLSGAVKFKLKSNADWITAKSVLVPAGCKLSIDNKDAVIAVCYLDSTKPDYIFLKKQMKSVCSGVYYNHKDEDKLCAEMLQLRDDKPCFAEAQQRMENIIYQGVDPGSFSIDPRIKHIVERLRDTAALNISVKSLAGEVGISESGLIKLFNQHVGAPIRKHRIWYRLVSFWMLTVAGVTGDKCIKQAGFTDAAHFSRCYSSLFGVYFSYAASRKLNANYIIEGDASLNPSDSSHAG